MKFSRHELFSDHLITITEMHCAPVTYRALGPFIRLPADRPSPYVTLCPSVGPSVRSALYLKNRVMNFLEICGNDSVGEYARTFFSDFSDFRSKMAILKTYVLFSQKLFSNFFSYFRK